MTNFFSCCFDVIVNKKNLKACEELTFCVWLFILVIKCHANPNKEFLSFHKHKSLSTLDGERGISVGNVYSTYIPQHIIQYTEKASICIVE